MRIGLIVDQSVSNWTLGVIARNTEIKLEMLCFSERVDNCRFENLVVQPTDSNSICCDALVIAVQNIDQIRSIFSHVLSFELSNDKIKIVVVRPSCINAKSDFIINNNFDQEKVIEFPCSDVALDLLSTRLHMVISPKNIAKEIYKTKDNIEAYQIENVYVNIIYYPDSALPPDQRIVGYSYTGDGSILDSCTNGRKQFCNKVAETYLPIETDNLIKVDNVCPLIRLWSANYYHFITEVCDKILIAEELGYTGKYMLYHNRDTEYLTLMMGISAERIIWIESDDIGKVFLISNTFDVEGFIVRTLRTVSRLCNKFNNIVTELIHDDNKQYPKMLYVPRMGSRKLLGVEEIIKEFDFYTFIPEEHSLEEEIKYFHNADIVLCPHGAATANTIFMKKGAAMVETCPCNWTERATSTFIIASAKNLIYRQIVELAYTNTAVPAGSNKDYHVNNPLLVYTLKELTDRMKQAE